MSKVLCVHRWNNTEEIDVLHCSICGESWNKTENKAAPEVYIGYVEDDAPTFRANEMKLKPVYCKHMWDTYGKDPLTKSAIALRCLRCSTIWKKLEVSKEPMIIIGYVDANQEEE